MLPGTPVSPLGVKQEGRQDCPRDQGYGGRGRSIRIYRYGRIPASVERLRGESPCHTLEVVHWLRQFRAFGASDRSENGLQHTRADRGGIAMAPWCCSALRWWWAVCSGIYHVCVSGLAPPDSNRADAVISYCSNYSPVCSLRLRFCRLWIAIWWGPSEGHKLEYHGILWITMKHYAWWWVLRNAPTGKAPE